MFTVSVGVCIFGLSVFGADNPARRPCRERQGQSARLVHYLNVGFGEFSYRSGGILKCFLRYV